MRIQLVTIAVLFCASISLADDQIFILQKQEEKASSRWSLSGWLEQRDRMRIQDLWLSLHSPSPYEFFVGGDYQFGRFSGGQYFGGWEAYAAAYATIAGLEVRNEWLNFTTRTSAIFDLRILGRHVQDTNLTLQGGVAYEDRAGVTAWNPLVGATLTIYVTRNLGIEALYRHFFYSVRGGLILSGDRFEAGGFMDFSFVRLFADYLTESESDGAALSRSGVILGTKLFF